MRGHHKSHFQTITFLEVSHGVPWIRSKSALKVPRTSWALLFSSISPSSLSWCCINWCRNCRQIDGCCCCEESRTTWPARASCDFAMCSSNRSRHGYRSTPHGSALSSGVGWERWGRSCLPARSHSDEVSVRRGPTARNRHLPVLCDSPGERQTEPRVRMTLSVRACSPRAIGLRDARVAAEQ